MNGRRRTRNYGTSRGLRFIALAVLQVTACTSVLAAPTSKEAIKLFETRKYPQALAALGPLARAGDGLAARYCGMIHEDGLAGKSDLKQAQSWYEMGARANDPVSMFRLSGVLDYQARDSRVKSKDIARASLYWLKKAADAGLMEAQKKFATRLHNGDVELSGLAVDKKERYRYLRMAAAQGDAKCAYRAGQMATRGKDIPRDMSSAVALFKQASTTLPEAGQELARIYSTGDGVKKDPGLAKQYANKAKKLEQIENDERKSILESLDRK